MDELKLCPFCGAGVRLIEDEHFDEDCDLEPNITFVIQCSNCPVSMESQYKDIVAKQWNGRVENQKEQDDG